MICFESSSTQISLQLPTTGANKRYVDAQDTALKALCVLKAGSTMSGALNMDNNKITNVETPTDDKDASTKKYVDDQDNLKVSKSGDTMSGELNMGTNKIVSLATPTADADAPTKKYVDDSHKTENLVDAAHATANPSSTYFNVNTPNTNGYHTPIELSHFIAPKKIVKFNLENFSRHNSAAVLNTTAIMGKVNSIDGYVNSCTLVMKSNTSAGLSSVKIMGSTNNLPNNFSIDLSETLTANLSTVGRYALVPTGTKFTALKYFGFYFVGTTSTDLIELEAIVEVCLV